MTRFLLVAAFAVVLSLAFSISSANAEPEMACVHGNTHSIGTSPFHCWCTEWAPNHKICRTISWSGRGRNDLPPVWWN